MLFNSLHFVILFVVTSLLYYIPPLRRFQIIVLILASFIFYGYQKPTLCFLLIFAIAVNTISSYNTLKAHTVERKKIWATLGVVTNLLLLISFKYAHLIVQSIFPDNVIATNPTLNFLIQIPLPIGISFFTFQGISLCVDVFRLDSLKTEMNLDANNFNQHLKKTAFFKAFFPQLIAGPIIKAYDFYPQIKPKFFADIELDRAIKYLITGYFLKMVVADQLRAHTFWIANPYFKSRSTVDLLVMLYGYSMQIFADFAGYSSIALGFACFFGYRLKENFLFPYISVSFSEFWRRWHISLSSFLREYLYFPLGGNRKGEFRTYFNLFAVMFLGGLWHGATWSYAVWGTFHGALLALERLLGFEDIPKTKSLKHIPRILFTFGMVSLAWLLFKLPNIQDAISFLITLRENTKLEIGLSLGVLVLLYSSPVVIWHGYYLLTDKSKFKIFCLKYDYVFYGTMLFLIAFNSGDAGEFIYFQF